MNFIKQNIKHLRDSLTLNQQELGEKLGYTRDNIASYERGTEPKIKFIQKFVNYFNISMEDFIDKDLSITEAPVYNSGENDSSGSNIPVKSEFISKTDTRQNIQRIPLYDHPGAISLTSLFQGDLPVIDYITIPNLPKSDGALYLTGDSMSPLLKGGDIAIYKRIHDISKGILFGEMYILSIKIDDDQATVVKFVQKSEKGEEWIKLVSQNSDHASKDFRLQDVVAMAMIKASIRINSMM